MIGGSFAVGQRLRLQSMEHRVFRDLGEGVIAIEELATGRISERSIADLLTFWNAGELILGDGSVTPASAHEKAISGAYTDAYRQSYPQADLDKAKAKLIFVERLEKLPRTRQVLRPLIREIWEDKLLWKDGQPLEKMPHPTTVMHWIENYKASNRDFRSLMGRHEGKGNSNSRHHPIVVELIDDLLQTRYLTQERPTLRSIQKEVKRIVAQRNATRLKSDQLTAPGYTYFRERVHEMAPYDVYRARYGQRAAEIKFRAAGRNALALRPLARAAMDHSRMDVMVVDERTGLPLGRPWLTLVLDEYSRYVLGYYLGFEEPSVVSMTRALRHAMAPKAANPDLKCVWDAWGAMELLVVDNGLEFHAKALEAGARQFGTDISFCPRRKPWFKGKIERFFGTMNAGLLAEMKGKTFSSVLLRGDYDPAKHAVMSLETLRRVLQIWIVDVYHQEPHSGLGSTPAAAWKEGIPRVDRYLPPSSLAVESAFSATYRRELSHKGIEFDSLSYNSRELGALRELHGSQFNVEVRTSDDDLGHIVVVAPDARTLLKIPALDTEYAAGLTRWQHKVCKRFRQRMLEDEARDITLLEARQRIRQLIQEDMQGGSRKSRKNQQRFMETGPSNPSAVPAPSEPSSSVDLLSTSPVTSEGSANAFSASPESALRQRVPAEIAGRKAANTELESEQDDLPVLASRRVRQGLQP